MPAVSRGGRKTADGPQFSPPPTMNTAEARALGFLEGFQAAQQQNSCAARWHRVGAQLRGRTPRDVVVLAMTKLREVRRTRLLVKRYSAAIDESQRGGAFFGRVEQHFDRICKAGDGCADAGARSTAMLRAAKELPCR